MALTNFDALKAGPMGKYTVVAADDTAGTKTINTAQFLGAGENYTGFIVQIYRAGIISGADVAVSLSNNNLVIADGATYKLTANDVINYIVY